ncbi:histone-like nucleoid-structuring protein Lsr2 [Dactylosporangium sp. CA-152071]|uniref:histone-like nucleoid-structuring protein Lsr2 n=1 Tax=Dactylosporangium sp. CA-152071 TaxID=3239933 RepID=UPI003D91A35D
MARRSIQVLVDDLDGGAADETVRFALDGTLYEIDLNSTNAAKLRAAVGPFLQAATPIRRNPSKAAPNTGRHRDGPDIRAWARAAGYELRDRGRISNPVLAAYHAATAGDPADAQP